MRLNRPLSRLVSISLTCGLIGLAANSASAQSFRWLGHVVGAVPSDEYFWRSPANGVSGNGTVVGDFVPAGGAFGGPIYKETAWSWKDGVYTALPLTRANYISANSRVIIGELDIRDDQGGFISTAPVRWELNDKNEVEVTASADGPVIKLDDGIPEPIPNKSAFQQANGKWKEEFHFTNFRVRGVSADGKTFVGAKYPGLPSDQTPRAAIWTEEKETILPLLPGTESSYKVYMEALAVSGDGSIVVGYADVRYSEAFPESNDLFAFIWTKADGIRTIADAAKALKIKWIDDWEPNQATAISTDGRFVAGWGDRDGMTYEPWILQLVPSNDIVVNSTTDRPRAANATGCETGEFIANGDRECTLRSAIEAINAGVGTTIEFDIPANESKVIALTSNLPAVTVPVTIDGTTQENDLVEILGNATLSHGLRIEGGASIIKGLVLNGFTGKGSAAIVISGEGENTIMGNRIGVDVAGEAAMGDFQAISIDGSPGNIVGGGDAESQNILFGDDSAVVINGAGADNNQVVGNRIGMSKSGSALGGGPGVYIKAGIGNQVGGSEALGNRFASDTGVLAASDELPLENLKISGNRIGLDGAGDAANETFGTGILLGSSESSIVTDTLVENNQIAGNGIAMWTLGTSGTTVSNNRMGLQFDGGNSLPGKVDPEKLLFGVRFEASEKSTFSDNTIAGYIYNVLVVGESLFSSSIGDPDDPKDDSITWVFPNEFGGGDPLGTVETSDYTISNNTVGLAGSQPPATSKQLSGIAVFGYAGDVDILNNTVAGHARNNIWIQTGAVFNISGNRLGLDPGSEFSAEDGIVITKTTDATVGSLNNPNIIGNQGNAGILLHGSNLRTRIIGNKIGANNLGTQGRPNFIGVEIVGNNEAAPLGTFINHNTIAFNLGTGISIKENSISPTVEIKQNSIFENGLAGATVEQGIDYQEDLPAPSKLVVLKSVDPFTGTVTFTFAMPPLEGGFTEATIEVFGNPTLENAQGKTFIFREDINNISPLVKTIVAEAGSALAATAKFRATATYGGKTSEFISKSVRVDGILPSLKFGPVREGEITLIWDPNPAFKLVTNNGLTGSWTEPEGTIIKFSTHYQFALPTSEDDSRFFSLQVDIESLLAAE